ncbi:hypothetical protein [Sinomonas sp. ASV322]|uniref:hypothetical protein n=1 Tax=Sinomonas sp. ASV322 TaxID=3041920 RepID=UPI0027DCC4DF|nr:hypothetical protein [Sinomonas sp. ASV322]MDQ4504093.1 hypothetical protein [Sinomonas sp. ASV322]
MDADSAGRLIADRWPAGIVASTRQLRDGGLDDRLITFGVRAGVLERIRRGAYTRSEQWRSLSPWERDDYRIDAHAAGAQSPATYSHTSAARLHGFAVWNAGPVVHVVSRDNSGSSHGSDTVTHRAPASPDEPVGVRTRDGRHVLATSPARTVIDCARFLAPEAAAVIGDSALNAGLTIGELTSTLESAEFARGRARAARLLGMLDGRAESAGETRTRLMLGGLGIERPEAQYCIETAHGLFRADYAWPRLRVILEFDGRGKYFDYRPTPEALILERRREAALIEQGWTVIRITWADLDRPEVVAARLGAAFARAA